MLERLNRDNLELGASWRLRRRRRTAPRAAATTPTTASTH
jgi:hypothetical protein